ncbi:D-glycero-alpha-D-manno-heptose-1,7-bisphosphate 7-phosphatase [Spirosoma gilvum]
MNKAVFWDKDGTLIPDIPYNVDPAAITLYPDAGTSLAQLRKAGFLLIVISNQAGVAQGKFSEEALSAVWQRLSTLLKPFGAVPDGYYYCPHHPTGSVKRYTQACDCRKPQPGLLLQAAREHRIDLRSSWMVGDILNDVEAGNRAGCQTILIDRGNETEWVHNLHRQPTTQASTIQQAVNYILNQSTSPFRPSNQPAENRINTIV